MMAPPARHAFDCALVSTLETYDDPENGNYAPYFVFFLLWTLCLLYSLCALQYGWSQLVPKLYMSLITESQFFMSFR